MSGSVHILTSTTFDNTGTIYGTHGSYMARREVIGLRPQLQNISNMKRTARAEQKFL